MAKCGQTDGDNHVCVAAPGNHATCMDGLGHVWRNPAFQEGPRNRHLDPDKRPTKQVIAEAAKNTKPEHRAGPIPPLVRADDPSTSHEAIRRYEPKRESAKGRVLAYLRSHPGEWVDAVVLTAPEVGGFAGTRRLRELRRDDGWPIETRPKPGTTNVWQHRLVPDGHRPRPVGSGTSEH